MVATPLNGELFRGGMARDDIIKAALKGAEKANRTFSKWSDGGWICDYGVEGFLVGEIARSIKKACPKMILSMEAPFKEMLGYSGKRGPGRIPAILKGAKRVDIALWDPQWRPTYVIEVKRDWYGGCYDDLRRLHELRRNYSTVECGLFVLLVLAQGDRKELEEQVKGNKEWIRENLPECKYRFHCGLKYNRPFTEGGWMATSLCLEMYGPPANGAVKGV